LWVSLRAKESAPNFTGQLSSEFAEPGDDSYLRGSSKGGNSRKGAWNAARSTGKGHS
jgi:hypothetical protein